MSYIPNENLGIDSTDVSDQKRAKAADLVTLPQDIEGTNCSNCKFASPFDNVIECLHPEVKLLVTQRMCCAFWDNKKALRSF